ncbi:LOW QUALITY PROTEIN: hypothetical protein V2J09_019512 [Rumex salicifolius]
MVEEPTTSLALNPNCEEGAMQEASTSLQQAVVVVVYAPPPSVYRRRVFWSELKEELCSISGPYFIGGDFNCITSQSERQGGSGLLHNDSATFRDLINDTRIIDMGFTGQKFTWSRGLNATNLISKRLDRILVDSRARLLWPSACVRHLPKFASDHTPLLLMLQPRLHWNKLRRPFSCVAFSPGVQGVFGLQRKRDLHTAEALSYLRQKLTVWNAETFGNIHKRKTKILEDLDEVQINLGEGASDILIQRSKELQAEIELVLHQEEILRRRNRIDSLQDADGVWIENQEGIERIATDFFRDLYTIPLEEMNPITIPHGHFPALSDSAWQDIAAPFTDKEIAHAVRQMGALKAPGPDGYQPTFFQKSWEVVGSSMISAVKDFFATSSMPSGVNETLIALIPKIENPSQICNFRPISLCNVLYKTVTKVLSNRMQPILGDLIGPTQDNIILAQEIVHSMNYKKGAKGWMLLKVDLEKAYDHLRWDFLVDTLHDAGFPDKWVGWISECVSTASLRVLLNGEATTQFQPSRGIRQGDPISPYLFILCIERLSQMIIARVQSRSWRPIRISRGGPAISHMLFADDILLMAEASVTQIQRIKACLDEFCRASGQRVNCSKTKLFISPNVAAELGHLLERESGFTVTTDLGSYLVTLAKSVLSALHVYTMGSIALPKRNCEEIDRQVRDLSRGAVMPSGECTSLAGMQREEVWRPWDQEHESAELRSPGQAWVEEGLLWSSALRAKYIKPSLSIHRRPSHVWRGINLGIHKVVTKGCSWTLGNGKSIRFWEDAWLTNEPLKLEAHQQIHGAQENVVVCSYWNEGSGWRWDELTSMLPAGVLLRLAACAPYAGEQNPDVLSWASTSDGNYSVRSAYDLLSASRKPVEIDSVVFKAIWKLVATERVKCFLWMTLRGCVLTNEERKRRHLTTSDACDLCPTCPESLLHMFRDCTVARES